MSTKALRFAKSGSNCSMQAGYRLATNTWLRKHRPASLAAAGRVMVDYRRIFADGEDANEIRVAAGIVVGFGSR